MDVPEEDKQSRQDQSRPDVKQHQAENGVHQQNKLPGKGDLIQHTEDKEHAQGQAKVDEGLNVFGKQKQPIFYKKKARLFLFLLYAKQIDYQRLLPLRREPVLSV